jgi:hypothetical protein
LQFNLQKLTFGFIFFLGIFLFRTDVFAFHGFYFSFPSDGFRSGLKGFGKDNLPGRAMFGRFGLAIVMFIKPSL